MVLFKVDPHCPSFAPLEGDAPGAVDVDRIASRSAAKRVEVKPWLMQRLEPSSAVDRGQTHQDPALQIGSNASASAGFEQLAQSAVPKAFDHGARGPVRRANRGRATADVKPRLTLCQVTLYTELDGTIRQGRARGIRNCSFRLEALPAAATRQAGGDQGAASRSLAETATLTKTRPLGDRGGDL